MDIKLILANLIIVQKNYLWLKYFYEVILARFVRAKLVATVLILIIWI